MRYVHKKITICKITQTAMLSSTTLFKEKTRNGNMFKVPVLFITTVQ